MSIAAALRNCVFSTLFIFVTGGIAPAFADAVKIASTGGAMAAMQALAEDFKKARPDAAIVVLPAVGSSGAIKAVAQGAIDIGVSARMLHDGERSDKLEQTEFARTPFVFVVSNKNPVSGLRQSELIDIYAGRRATWPDGSRIRLIMRPADDSDSIILKTQFSPAMKQAVEAAEARPGMLIGATDLDAANLLDHTPGALGVLSLGQVISERRSLKVLPVDGREPSVKAAATGAYRYSKTLYLLTSTGTKPLAREFISFAQSDRGKQLLAQLGFWTESGKRTN